MYEKIKVSCEAIVLPNVALFKFYKLPAKLEGNLLVITYLLNNTLDAIFDRLKREVIPEIQIPRLHTTGKGLCFQDLSLSQFRSLSLCTFYDAPEPEIEFSDPFMIEEQIFTEGLADINPV